MSAVLVGLLIVAAVLAVAAGGLVWWRASVARRLTKHRVLVTTKTGETFAGILTSFDRRLLVLADAAALGDEQPVRVDGELFVLVADVAYMQRP